MKRDFLLAGVGGQGTILAGDILAEVGLRAGYEAKKSEVHGMSQRGGQVETHVRWGDRVYSPLIEAGRADYLLGFEMLEAARWAGYVSPRGVCIVNNYRIAPPSVSQGVRPYPERESIEELLVAGGRELRWVEATDVARSLGSTAVAGVVLLGALSAYLEVGDDIWLEAIRELVPRKHVELNLKAFLAGRNSGGER